MEALKLALQKRRETEVEEPNIVHLNSFKYDPEKQYWVPVPLSQESHTLQQLSVSTWNIYKDGQHNKLRFEAITTVLSISQPAIMAFQEMTVTMLNWFLSAKWIQESYYSCYKEGNAVLPYGVVLFSKIPFGSITKYKIPSHLDRHAIIGTFSINSIPLSVVTTHLESGCGSNKAIQIRYKQLDIIREIIPKNSQFNIILGDFNTFSKLERDTQISRSVGWTDVWAKIHGPYLGSTCCGDRLDMVYSLAPDNIEPTSVALIGEEKIKVEGLHIYPSDHLGLLATFSIS